MISIILIVVFVLVIGAGIYFIANSNKNNSPNPLPPLPPTCDPGFVLDKNGNCVKPIPPPPPPPPPSSICNNNGHKGPDGKCICDKNYSGDNCEIICNGHATIVNGSCDKCADGYSGIFCQCDDSKKPSTNVEDTCIGMGYECQLDGSWKEVPYATDCGALYNMNKDENGVGNKQTWINKCMEPLCSKQSDYANYDWILECDGSESGDGVVATCIKGCSHEPSENDCTGCNGIKGGLNQTCYCDSATTDNKWVCRQDQVSPCPPDSEAPKGLCRLSDGSRKTPDCIFCGDLNGYVWQCPMSLQNPICVQNGFNTSQNTTMSTNKIGNPPTSQQVIWYWDGTKTSEPVFPTINNDVCDSRINNDYAPYSTLDDKSDYGPQYGALNSQAGWVKGLSNSGAKVKSSLPFFIDDKNDNNNIKYNIIASKYKCKDGSASMRGKCLNNSSPDDKTHYCKDQNPNYSSSDVCSSGVDMLDASNIQYAIYGSDGQGPGHLIFNNNSGCLKQPSDYCKNGGTFTQYCFGANYKSTSCDSFNNPNPPIYRDDGGYCTCPTIPNYKDKNGNLVTYKGQFCQYSDTETCNGNGTVDDNGKCACHQYVSQTDGQTKTYLGQYCQYSDNYCDKGFTSDGTNDPNTRGGTIYGIGTMNADGTCNYDCDKIMPRCASCKGNTNLTSGQVPIITCENTINPYDNNANKNGPIFNNCKVISTDPNNPSTEYGCEMIQDAQSWTPYVGGACHGNDSDMNSCHSGASICRMPVSANDPDYCYLPDFTTTNYNWNTKGLNLNNSRSISGVGCSAMYKGNNDGYDGAFLFTNSPGYTCNVQTNGSNCNVEINPGVYINSLYGGDRIEWVTGDPNYKFGNCDYHP